MTVTPRRSAIRMSLCIALISGLVAGAYASLCPVMIVSGTGDRDGIAITVRNLGKLPIRQLQLRCVGVSGKAGHCGEANALFYPGMEYMLRYPYPAGRRGVVTVAVQSATTSDGFVWRPTKRQPCRQIRISPPKAKR